MLKVAIVGCGKIADSHSSLIERIPGCEIVGVCDKEDLMAQQLYERFPVKRYFSDLTALLTEAKPDVVHVTTPPQSHFSIAKVCLESGCHVFVEKPFTLHAEEAEHLVSLANEKGLNLTAGHDDQFSLAARRLRNVVQSGYLGGPPVHMESHFCYDIGSTAYARALLGDKRHWVRSLPGKLLQNIISHGIARIAEFLAGDSPEVMACGFVSPLLKRFGETEIMDELRVIIRDEQETTAYFTFSSQMHPSVHQFCIYGPRNGLLLNQDHETLIRLRGAKFKSYLEKFVPPIVFAKQYAANCADNVKAFLKRDLHMRSGMGYLIESFYRSITEGAPVPIPYREILLTARIMDRIFDQIYRKPSEAHAELAPRATETASHLLPV